MSLNIELLEQSFEQVKPQATQFAASFYKNLLTDYPQLQPLFSNTNMEAQEQKLIMSLVLVVENLRSPQYLKTILKNLGERHVGYRAKQEHYAMVGAALLKTFESYLGKDWTPNVKQAWTDAYGAIVDMMLAGAKPAEEALKLKSVSQSTVSLGADVGEQPQIATSDVSYEQPSDSENSFLFPTNPVVINQPSISSNQSSTPNYAQSKSKVENLASHNGKSISTEQAEKQDATTKSSFNFKLLLIASVVVGVLGIGLLYYQANSQPDNGSVESQL